MSEAQTGDPVAELLITLDLVSAAIALVNKALASNPSTEERRSLNRAKLRLETERTLLRAQLDAALGEDPTVEGPSDSQMLEIARLTDAVEEATTSALTVSASIALAGRVLDISTDVLRVS